MDALLEFPPSLTTEPIAAARILVVDDDETIRGLEAAILRRAGFTVDVAAGGAAGWKALLNESYDLLVTDYLMPGVSGLALVRQLRVAHMELSVVLVSGLMETIDTAKLARDPWTRIAAFVRKPFEIPDFLHAVKQTLAAERAGSGLRSAVLA